MAGFLSSRFAVTGAYDENRMQTQELFHDDFRDALRHAVKALGGYDAVGVDLWPAKTRKAAGAWLSDCLNPERPAKLDLEEVVQILRMARDKGIHCGMYQLCDEALYAHPPIVAPKSPLEEKAERLERLAAEFKRLAAEVAAEARPTLIAAS